ncbi:hypothetical protein [Marinobacter salicampi]|uniref:hypothetical protein n=1 Tax=Marinobacter salicampi TaxID=435907 RepID=UPI00140B968B|nr:hypothetical protein [Marinobacter salicampi]
MRFGLLLADLCLKLRERFWMRWRAGPLNFMKEGILIGVRSMQKQRAVRQRDWD